MFAGHTTGVGQHVGPHIGVQHVGAHHVGAHHVGSAGQRTSTTSSGYSSALTRSYDEPLRPGAISCPPLGLPGPQMMSSYMYQDAVNSGLISHQVDPHQVDPAGDLMLTEQQRILSDQRIFNEQQRLEQQRLEQQRLEQRIPGYGGVLPDTRMPPRGAENPPKAVRSNEHHSIKVPHTGKKYQVKEYKRGATYR